MDQKRRNENVKKRRVFYIPGYDPFHPRRYRELYRKEGRSQADISDYTLDLKAKNGGGRYGWFVSAQIDGKKTTTEFDVLVWSDIVRGSMDIGTVQTYGLLLRTAYTYITSGALRALMKLRKGPVIAALYPVGMLLLQAMLAVMMGLLVWYFTVGIHPIIGVVLAAAAILMLLRYFRKIDNKLFVYYLMHDYAYSAQHNGANSPDLETRMAAFKTEIAQALHSDVDEVLVVGHSSGAHIGISVVADLLRDTTWDGPDLSVLTLGQVVPMVSFLPDAWRLRADLQFLSTRRDITWVDVTAPGDGCAFALCDPVGVSGVATPDQKWPLVFSAAFTHSLSKERWKELRWKFFRLHFQYLCAFDQPKDYDYFQITAGPVPLQVRYQDRSPSKSRIVAATSPHNGVEP
ncbi:MAG: hypothetical protein ACPGVK_00220 [Halocynthiibacter sp.]